MRPFASLRHAPLNTAGRSATPGTDAARDARRSPTVATRISRSFASIELGQQRADGRPACSCSTLASTCSEHRSRTGRRAPQPVRGELGQELDRQRSRSEAVKAGFLRRTRSCFAYRLGSRDRGGKPSRDHDDVEVPPRPSTPARPVSVIAREVSRGSGATQSLVSGRTAAVHRECAAPAVTRALGAAPPVHRPMDAEKARHSFVRGRFTRSSGRR